MSVSVQDNAGVTRPFGQEVPPSDQNGFVYYVRAFFVRIFTIIGSICSMVGTIFLFLIPKRKTESASPSTPPKLSTTTIDSSSSPNITLITQQREITPSSLSSVHTTMKKSAASPPIIYDFFFRRLGYLDDYNTCTTKWNRALQNTKHSQEIIEVIRVLEIIESSYTPSMTINMITILKNNPEVQSLFNNMRKFMRENTTLVSMKMLFVDKDAIDIKIDIHEKSHECNDEATLEEIEKNKGDPITVYEALCIIPIYQFDIPTKNKVPPQMQYKIHAKVNAECDTEEPFQKSLNFDRSKGVMIPAQFSIGDDSKKATEKVKQQNFRSAVFATRILVTGNNDDKTINIGILATLTRCNDLGIRNIHIMIESDTQCDEIHKVKRIEQVIGAIMRYGIYFSKRWEYIQNITILYDDSQLSRAENINAINTYLNLLSPQNQEAIMSVS